jgi:hypothetical protein
LRACLATWRDERATYKISPVLHAVFSAIVLFEMLYALTAGFFRPWKTLRMLLYLKSSA